MPASAVPMELLNPFGAGERESRRMTPINAGPQLLGEYSGQAGSKRSG